MTDEQEIEFLEDLLEQYEEAYDFTRRAYGLPNDEHGLAVIAIVNQWNEEQFYHWVDNYWTPHMMNLFYLREEVGVVDE